MYAKLCSCYTKITMKPEDTNQNYWDTPTDDQAPENAPEVISEKVNADENIVTWTAQEYVHMDKSPIWFVVFVFVVLALISIDIFILKSWTFSVLVIVMAIAVIIYTRRSPRMLTYGISGEQGLYVGERLYHFEEFKAFGLIKDGEHNSVMLIPTKRFSPGVSVYFPEDAGEEIVDILGQRLPMENLKLDIIDVIVRKLRL